MTARLYNSSSLASPVAGKGGLVKAVGLRPVVGGCADQPKASRRWAGFTVIELMVVLAIVGLVTAIGLPAMRDMKKSNVISSVNRQLRDDLARARQRAIKDRTTVYVVFMPPANPLLSPMTARGPLTGLQWTNLLSGQLVSYALFTQRGVGEQPGRLNPRYLTEWHTLPEGVFIPFWKFIPPGTNVDLPGQPKFPIDAFPYAADIPIPRVTGATNIPVPYVAFDHLGRLTTFQDAYIPIARGGIFLATAGAGGGLTWSPPDALERPAGNSVLNYDMIRIDGLTGQTKVVRPELQ